MAIRFPIPLLTGFLFSALSLVGEPAITTRQVEAAGSYGHYDFTLTTIDGHKVKLSDYQDKVVLVNFWATWCGPCVYETPALVRLYNQYRSHGFVVIGVAQGSEEGAVTEFSKKFNIPYPIGRDSTGEIGLSYGVFAIPTSFLFSPDGSVKRKIEGGYGEQTYEVLGRDVQALLDVTPVPQEPQNPETMLADQTKEEPSRPERYAALQPSPAQQNTLQPETHAVEEGQGEATVTYRRWNFAVPLFAMVGLLILSRIRLKVVPIGATGAVSPAAIEPQQSVPYARLLLQGSHDSLPQEIALLHDDILIGSGPECDVILRHPSIARQHARVQWRKQGYVLGDLQSPTGVFVNGRRVSENLLKDGWIVRLGEVEFVFLNARCE